MTCPVAPSPVVLVQALPPSPPHLSPSVYLLPPHSQAPEIPVFPEVLRIYSGPAGSLPRPGFRFQVFTPFQTNLIQCFYQTRDAGCCQHVPPWKCTSGSEPVADAVADFPRGLGPSLSAWQALVTPKLISTGIHAVEKYSGCLREPPVKTVPSLLLPPRRAG